MRSSSVRNRYPIVAPVAVAIILLAGWAILARGGEDSGSDETPVGQLSSVSDLANILNVAPLDAAGLGTALGEMTVLLSGPQDFDAIGADCGEN